MPEAVPGFVLLLATALPAAAQEGDDYIRRRISTMRITVRFEETPIKEVVQYLRDVVDINILLDRDVDGDRTVTLEARGITVKSLLDYILNPHDLTWLIHEEILHIVPGDHPLVRKRMKLRVYDIQDMLYRLPDFPGGEITFGETGIQIVQPPAEVQPDTSDVLQEILMAFTGGSRVWDRDGAEMVLQNGMLIVRQTPEIHAKLEALLSELRRLD